MIDWIFNNFDKKTISIKKSSTFPCPNLFFLFIITKCACLALKWLKATRSSPLRSAWFYTCPQIWLLDLKLSQQSCDWECLRATQNQLFRLSHHWFWCQHRRRLVLLQLAWNLGSSTSVCCWQSHWPRARRCQVSLSQDLRWPTWAQTSTRDGRTDKVALQSAQE